MSFIICLLKLSVTQRRGWDSELRIGEGVEGKGRGLICIIPFVGMCLEWMEDHENPQAWAFRPKL